MLFWPGVPGEFMGMLPVTLIFVLSASLVVALVYLPVIGGVSARLSRIFERGSAVLRAILPYWARLILTVFAGWLMFTALALLIVLIAHRAQWLHRTPLSALHVALVANMVPFAFYDMPVHYGLVVMN